MPRETKYSGTESFGFVPTAWRITRLKSILTPTGETNSGDRELLSVYLDRGVISYSESTGLQVHKPSEDLSNYQNVEIGDFVLNNQQAWRGSVGVSKYCGIISPAYLIYKFTEEVDLAFMNYLLRDCSMVQQYEIASRGVGTIQRNIYAPWLLNSLIVIPPLEEQRHISAFLNRKCNEIDSIVADTQRTIEEYKALKQAVITEAVTRGVRGQREMKESGIEWIGNIPSDWNVAKIKHSIKWKSVKGNPDGTVLSLYRDYGVIPKDSRDDNHNVTSLDTSTYKVVDVGDFVINKMKAWQGSMAVSNYCGIISPAYHVCEIINPGVYKKYFHHLLRNHLYLPEYTRLSTGMRIGQWDLGFDDFKNLPFVIPPYDEQIEIVEYIEKVCKKYDTLIERKTNLLEEMESYRKSVIHEYVTGKKEVPACQ